MKPDIEQAAEIVRNADALLITAGAGMGVDSGLPDFRGNEGFWNAYPPYRKLGKSFVEMANPAGFASDPAFAWGFYGHRLNLYRETRPHRGFSILQSWSHACDAGSFVMTSNVDGQFQASGFPDDSIYEVHGSIHYLQCSRPCPKREIRPATSLEIAIDPSSMRATSPLPRCPHCSQIERPNILMFGDGSYLGDRNDEQEERLRRWLYQIEGARLAIIEMGAGSAVPTVRMFSEQVARNHTAATLIRINPREPETPDANHMGISGGALETLNAIDTALAE